MAHLTHSDERFEDPNGHSKNAGVLPLSKNTDGASLPWDILLALPPYLGCPDVSCFMRTCRTLYHSPTVISVLINSADTILLHPDVSKLHAFCRCVLRTPERPLLLRSLCVGAAGIGAHSISRMEQDAMHALSQVITSACALTSLYMTNVELLLGVKKRLARAITSLRNLRHLSLTDMQRKGARMLAGTRSPVLFATIFFDDSFHDSLPVFPLLSGFKHLHWLNIRSGSLPLHNPRGGVQFHNMYNIMLFSCLDRLPLQDFAYTFPNLRHFYHSCPGFSGPDDPESQRSVNQQQVDSWSSLDTLSCSVDWGYAFGLTCPVHHWKIVRSVHSLGFNISRLHACLSDLRPKHLTMSIMVTDLSEPMFSNVLPPTTQLTDLNFTVRLETNKHDMLKLFTSLQTTFAKQQSLVFLILRLRYTHRTWTIYSDDEDRDVEPVDTTNNYLKAMDVGAFVSDLAERMPALKQVDVVFEGRQQGNTCWTVEHATDGSAALSLARK